MPLAKPVHRSRSDRTGHETTDCFKIGKGVCQGCTLSPCLFNLHAEYIMGNTGIDKAQAGIKIAKRNINNLKYAGLATERETKDRYESTVVCIRVRDTESSSLGAPGCAGKSLF